MIVPEPAADAVPYNDPITRLLDPGEQMKVSFTPTQQVTEFILPILAMSKHPASSYEAWMDGQRVYGPAPVPPTDIDDLVPTFIPARRFSSSLTIFVRNLSETTTRRYTVQPLGWEVAQ